MKLFKAFLDLLAERRKTSRDLLTLCFFKTTIYESA